MKNKHEFTIKIDGEEWEKAQNAAFEKRNKKAPPERDACSSN